MLAFNRYIVSLKWNICKYFAKRHFWMCKTGQGNFRFREIGFAHTHHIWRRDRWPTVKSFWFRIRVTFLCIKCSVSEILFPADFHHMAPADRFYAARIFFFAQCDVLKRIFSNRPTTQSPHAAAVCLSFTVKAKPSTVNTSVDDIRHLPLTKTGLMEHFSRDKKAFKAWKRQKFSTF